MKTTIPPRRAVRSVVCASLLFLAGCTTIRHTAVNQLGNALASGGETYSSDDDPELIRAAAPFSLKLIETVLAETPEHRGLLLTASSGFTQYAFAFVQQEADEIEARDVAQALVQRERARRLYLRAREFGLRALEVSHPGLRARLPSDSRGALASCSPQDVPLLYWTSAAWFGAIAIIKDRPDLIAELPQAEALMDRALSLDETYAGGALHSFLISYEMARQGVSGDPAARARIHFDRAVELSRGLHAAPYVNFAEAVCVPQQDRAGFASLLDRALAIDPNREPPSRLENLILQRRARWLLARTDELFLPGSAAPALSSDTQLQPPQNSVLLPP